MKKKFVFIGVFKNKIEHDLAFNEAGICTGLWFPDVILKEGAFLGKTEEEIIKENDGWFE